MLRRIPNKGMGYGILKYITPEEFKRDIRFESKPLVSFNYLGRFDEDLKKGLFRIAEEPMGTPISSEVETTSEIDINGMVSGRQLRMTIYYNQKLFEEKTIEKIAFAFEKELNEVTRYCMNCEFPELTPSDIDYKGLSVDELEKVISNLEG
jgi:non-ribosomal peptide synthase protein (TIGR01720 family)